MDYRTIDDMYERGTLVRLTDLWTPGLARYRDRAAVVIDIEVLGYPRTISRQENGTTISQKYDCIYTVALIPMGSLGDLTRDNVPVIRVISLDVESGLEQEKNRKRLREPGAPRNFVAQTRTGLRKQPARYGRSHRRRGFAAHDSDVRGAPPARRSSQQIFGRYRPGETAARRITARRDCVGIDPLDAAGRILYRRRRTSTRMAAMLPIKA